MLPGSRCPRVREPMHEIVRAVRYGINKLIHERGQRRCRRHREKPQCHIQAKAHERRRRTARPYPRGAVTTRAPASRARSARSIGAAVINDDHLVGQTSRETFAQRRRRSVPLRSSAGIMTEMLLIAKPATRP